MRRTLQNLVLWAFLRVAPAASSSSIIRSQDRWPGRQTLLEVDENGRLHAVAGHNQSEGQAGTVSSAELFADVAAGLAGLSASADCWKQCHKRAGKCAACGARKACCRKGWLKDPWECGGGGCKGYHCCVGMKGDCEWGAWGPWSSCSKRCGRGEKTRKRSVKHAAAHGGKACSGAAKEVRHCNQHQCSVDCKYKPWGGWGPCSKTCAGGKQHRKREMAPAVGGGKKCEGTGGQHRACSTQPCPIDCKWKPWDTWGTCSVPCGGGEQSRTRSKHQAALHGGMPCTGMSREKRDCNTKPCAVHCRFHPWGGWGPCSRSCGGGKQQRDRTRTNARHGGTECEGPASQHRQCNVQGCPRDCKLKHWEGWGQCTRSCDGGYRQRRRGTVPAENGGAPCYGKLMEAKRCNVEDCPTPAPPTTESTSTATTTTGLQGRTTMPMPPPVKSGSVPAYRPGAVLLATGGAAVLHSVLRATCGER